METLWGIGLANAAVVAVLAPAAALVGRIARRPAWAHALWIIVLLKLVTPPVAGVPIGIESRWLAGPGEAEQEVVAEAEGPAIESPPIRDLGPIDEAVAIGPVEAKPSAKAKPARAWWNPAVSWPRVLGLAWLAGSAAWLALAAWRIARFARAIRRADPAPEELAAWVERLSESLGLARPPVVILSPGRVGPMVWALGGRARLVVPEALWKRLDHEQRAALLVHELAHLRRRDHWVRVLELAATGLYWWHPALWWARKGLHRAEEECCDLWVVWALPEAKRTYATALVEAVEFLSEDRPRPLPVGASGMGQVQDLSRRIGMIMRGDTPRGLSRGGVLAALGLAVLLLPWRPTLAQEAPAKAADETKAEAKEKEIVGDIDNLILQKEVERAKLQLEWAREMEKKGYVSHSQVLANEVAVLRAQKKLKEGKGDGPEPAADAKGAQDDLDDATKSYTEAYMSVRARLRNARAQVARTEQLYKGNAVSSAEVDEAKAKVLELQERLEALEARSRAEAEAREQAAIEAANEVAVLKSQLQTKRAAIAKAEAQRQLAAANSARLERIAKKGAGFVSIDETTKAEAELAVATAGVAEAQALAQETEVKLTQAAERAERLKRAVAAGAKRRPPAADPTRPAAPDADKRLDDLESKFDRVLKELEALRKDQAGKTTKASDRFESRSAPAQS